MHALMTLDRGRMDRPRLKAINRAALLALLLASGGAAPTWAQAQAVSATARYAIDAKDLGQALREYGAASGTTLLSYPPEWVQGLRGSAVRGQYSADEALRRLLEGTGLRAVAQPGGGYVLERVPRQAVRSVDLPTISVTAAHERAEDIPYRQARSSAYLDREQVERFRGTSAADFLSGVAGVHTGDVRNGGALDVNVRGIQGQNRVPVIVDGGQQSIDTYRGYAGQQQRSYLDPDLISEVMVDKGPTLAADAAGAIGGAVRISTLQARDILAEGQSSGWRLRGSLGDNSIKRSSGFYTRARNRGGNADMGNFANASGSLAYAFSRERYDLVAAYAWRRQGNYFAGRRGVSDYDGHNLSSPGTGMGNAPVNEYYRAGDEVLNTHTRNESLLLKATLRPTDEQALELSYRYFDSWFGEIMPSSITRIPASSGWVTYVQPEGTMYQFEPGRMRIHSLSARHRYQPEGNDWIDLKTNFWLTAATSRMYNANVANVPLFGEKPYSGGPDPLGATYDAALRSDISNRRWGVDVSNTSRLSSAVGAFKFDYGAAFQHENMAPNSPRVDADLNNNRFLRNGTRREASVSGSVEWRPVERLALLAGGRYSDYALRDRNRLASVAATRDQRYRQAVLTQGGEPLPGQAAKRWFPDADGNYTWDSLRNSAFGEQTLGTAFDFDGMMNWGGTREYTIQVPSAWSYQDPRRDQGSGFVPTFSASFDLDANSLVYVRYAQGLRMPSLFDATLGNLSALPGDNLKPERNRMLEVGASTLRQGLLRPGDRAAFKLAWFSNDIRDAVTRDFDSRTWSLRMRNVDRFKTSGFEFQSSYDTGMFYAQLSGTYYKTAKTCDAGTAARLRASSYPAALKQTPDCVDGGFGGSFSNQQNPPRYSLSTTLGARLLQQRLDVGVRRVYNSGPRYTLNQPWHVNAPLGAQNPYRAAAVYDVYASWAYSPRARLNLMVQNVTDRYYMDAMALSRMPAPGRTFNVSFDLKF